MTFQPGRTIGLGLLFFTISVAAPLSANWFRDLSRLPAGYGAEGDRQRAARVPATAAWGGPRLPWVVRKAAAERAAGAEASWVRGTVEGGARVYELHVLEGGSWSVVRFDANGDELPPDAPNPEPAPRPEPTGTPSVERPVSPEPART